MPHGRARLLLVAASTEAPQFAVVPSIAVERLFDGEESLAAQPLWAAPAIVIRAINIAVGEPTLPVPEFTVAARL